MKKKIPKENKLENRTGLFLEEALGPGEHDKAAPNGEDEDDDDQDDRDEGGAPAQKMARTRQTPLNQSRRRQCQPRQPPLQGAHR